jgi:hypothetical protein
MIKHRSLLLLIALSTINLGFSQNEVRLESLLDSMPVLDDSIPVPADKLGIKIGERHLFTHEIVDYLDTLAEASPRMVALGEHARSYGAVPSSLTLSPLPRTSLGWMRFEQTADALSILHQT